MDFVSQFFRASLTLPNKVVLASTWPNPAFSLPFGRLYTHNPKIRIKPTPISKAQTERRKESPSYILGVAFFRRQRGTKPNSFTGANSKLAIYGCRYAGRNITYISVG
jgi:hypothetical protein